MSPILIGFLSALVAAAEPASVPGQVAETNRADRSANTNTALEKEYEKLLAEDKAGREEVDRWIQENNAFAAQGGGVPQAEMRRRVIKRMEQIRAAYEDFIKRHPKFAPVRIDYFTFLEDIGEEEKGVEQLHIARDLDPRDPEVWNCLANYHGHRGPVTKAFEYYEKAISLDPNESIYYHNFGTTVYLFRKDVKEHYGITDEQEVFNKALGLYRKAMELDPANFELATDVAQTYYGIRPTRTHEALIAWTNALKVARTQSQREGVYLHFARIKMNAGRFDEARMHLDAVTNRNYDTLKQRLTRNLNEKLSGTNAPPASSTNTPPETVR